MKIINATYAWGKLLLRIAVLMTIIILVFSCKKDRPPTMVVFKLTNGRACELQVWEYKDGVPKSELKSYNCGTHDAPWTETLPAKVGFTYMFQYASKLGPYRHGQILINGHVVADGEADKVTHTVTKKDL